MDLGEGLPPSARLRAMVAVAIAIAMAVLDSAIANIALPTIAHDMTTTPAASIWVVNAYQFAVTVSLLPLAFLGDIVSYKRVYMGGLAVFTVASLGCALSPSLPVLVIARVVQGFGGAGIMSVNTALIRFIFPRTELGRGKMKRMSAVLTLMMPAPPNPCTTRAITSTGRLGDSAQPSEAT